MIQRQHPPCGKHGKQRWIVMAGLASALLAACSHGSATGSQGALPLGEDSNGNWLSFYLDQAGVQVVGANGENSRLANYKIDLKTCEGHVSKSLNPADAEKVGTNRTQEWKDGYSRDAKLVEEFGYSLGMTGSGPSLECVFTPVHTAKLTIHLNKQNRVYDIDLVKRVGTVSTLPPSSPTDTLHSPPPNWNQLAQVGMHKLGESSSAGQPCTIIQSVVGTQECVWSGGAKWGYQVTDSDTPRLWIAGSPAVKSDVKSLTTTNFVIGQLKDSHIFDIPANIAISDQGSP